MRKRYLIETPEQLREMEPFCKTGTAANTATVWSAMRRHDGGKSRWDGKVEVVFNAEAGARVARVVRTNNAGEKITVAWIKYAPALEWSKTHLTFLLQPKIVTGCLRHMRVYTATVMAPAYRDEGTTSRPILERLESQAGSPERRATCGIGFAWALLTPMPPVQSRRAAPEPQTAQERGDHTAPGNARQRNGGENWACWITACFPRSPHYEKNRITKSPIMFG